jgi:hypothetical protein
MTRGAKFSANLAPFIRNDRADWLDARVVCRVDGGGFRERSERVGGDVRGSRGTRRVSHGPRVVMAPVMATSMEAWG